MIGSVILRGARGGYVKRKVFKALLQTKKT